MNNHIYFPLGLLWLCCLFISPRASQAQKGIFNGHVVVKSYDLLHDNNQSIMATALVQYSGHDRSYFDTIYHSAHICSDTLISEWRGMGDSVVHKSTIVGNSKILVSPSRSQANSISLRLDKNQSRIGSAKAKDWKKNKRKEQYAGFEYDYYLRNPDNPAVQLYAGVNQSIVYR